MRRQRWRVWLVAALALSATAATAAGVPLPSAGPVVAAERHLLAEAVALMLFVVVPVIVLTPWVAWRYRRSNRRSAYRPGWSFSWLLEVLIWGLPALVVAVLGYKVWTQSQALDPYRPVVATAVPATTAAPAPLEVQVVGLDWKWLFIYPDQRIAALNTLVLPVGRPVHLRLTSDTVMESLLMPQLAGQIYAMPGMITQLWLRADQPGDYLGENTQYNGSGFAKQSFVAHAVSAGEFERWVVQARAHGDDVLDASRYAQLSRRSVPPSPLLFGQADTGLFDRIVAKYHGTAHAPTAGAVMQPTAKRETHSAH